MRITLRIASLLPAASLLLFAQAQPRVETWSGHLVDASCAEVSGMLTPCQQHEGTSDRSTDLSGTSQYDMMTGTRTYERDDVIVTYTNDDDVHYASHEETWIQLGDVDVDTNVTTTGAGITGSSMMGGTTASTGTVARTDDVSGSSERVYDYPEQHYSGTADRDREDRACLITSSTNSYALRLEDGSYVRIDPASYPAISSAIQANDVWGRTVREGGETSNLKADVSGTMEGDHVRITTIYLK